jgi:hypothetical protein
VTFAARKEAVRLALSTLKALKIRGAGGRPAEIAPDVRR